MRRILWTLTATLAASCGQIYDVGQIDSLGRELGGACGSTRCPSNEVCCNASCGICVPPNGACIQLACEPADAGAARCTPADCGPRPGAPALTCSDGSVHDWECQHAADGSCQWQQQPCPTLDAGQPTVCGPTTCAAGWVCCNESCGICTPPNGVCTQQFCGPVDGGSASCTPNDCGPRPGAPALQCADGTIHDWECKPNPTGTCGWHQEPCPISDGGSSGPTPCGNSSCGAGLVCCNASCGICTPPNGFCTQQVCP